MAVSIEGKDRTRPVLQAVAAVGLLVTAMSSALANQAPESMFQGTEMSAGGWPALTDWGFWVESLLLMSLAAVLGAVLALHPKHGQTLDTRDDVETLPIYTIYSVVGAIVGIMVIRYGMVVGFVLFGIGGLIRFRTVLQSANRTGRVILVTLIGLACGMRLPHVALLSSVFGFMLFYAMDSRVTYRMDIKAIDPKVYVETAAAYRQVLAELTCNVLSEKKNPGKRRLTYIFRCKRALDCEQLEQVLEKSIDPSLRGIVNWEIG
jgi:hypothetical protein